MVPVRATLSEVPGYSISRYPAEPLSTAYECVVPRRQRERLATPSVGLEQKESSTDGFDKCLTPNLPTAAKWA